MAQAKLLMLVALLCLSFSYGVSSQAHNDIDYSSSKYDTSMQQDNVASNEKEDDSVDNVLNDYGPITICSERAVYDDDKKTLTYYDKVFVFQIHGKHILCKKPSSPKKNTVYFDRDKNSTFKELQKKWFEHAKKLCSKEKECNFISGQKLVLQLSEDKKVETLTMESKGKELSQFYNYPKDANKNFANSKMVTKGPADGVAKKIIYNVAKKDLELVKNSVVTQNGNKYRGEKVNYDMDHDLISIPGTRNKRSTIVLDGISEQTKIDTGLTPINKYHQDKNSGSTIMNNTVSKNSSNPADNINQQQQGIV